MAIKAINAVCLTTEEEDRDIRIKQLLAKITMIHILKKDKQTVEKTLLKMNS